MNFLKKHFKVLVLGMGVILAISSIGLEAYRGRGFRGRGGWRGGYGRGFGRGWRGGWRGGWGPSIGVGYYGRPYASYCDPYDPYCPY